MDTTKSADHHKKRHPMYRRICQFVDAIFSTRFYPRMLDVPTHIDEEAWAGMYQGVCQGSHGTSVNLHRAMGSECQLVSKEGLLSRRVAPC